MYDDEQLKASWYKLIEEMLHHNNLRAAEQLDIALPDTDERKNHVNTRKTDRRSN